MIEHHRGWGVVLSLCPNGPRNSRRTVESRRLEFDLAMIQRRLAALILLLAPSSGLAQPATPAGTDPIEAIDSEFDQKFRELERQRLDQLAQLASRSDGALATRVYETYFRSTLGSGLFREAEPIAERVLGESAASPVVHYLAQLVNIMAEADRGDFEASLQSIVAAMSAGKSPEQANEELSQRSLPVSARLSLLDTYHQRLVQAGQYDIALKAFTAIRKNGEEGGDPAVLTYLTNRIKQLEMVGKPAPVFQGVDVDGQPIRLEDFKGKPVLLVFWATWHQPNVEQVAWLKESLASYGDKGLQIIGVDLDSLANESRPIEELIPEIRRYVLEHNVSWPILVDAAGAGSIATAYGVSEIPANVLINRDGEIAAIDLNRANFDQEVDKVLGGSK